MGLRRPLRIFLGATLIAACGGAGSGGAPRSFDPNGRLSVMEDGFKDDGPFRVVFAGPKGESEGAREITVAFSRPVRPASILESEGLIPATVVHLPDRKPLEGTWRWFGERTAVFWPKPHGLKEASEYEVTVDPALRVDDTVVAPFPPFRFTTQRPALLRATHDWLEETDQHLITVDFNQEMAPDALKKSVRVEGKGAKGTVSIPFTVVTPKADDPTRFDLVVDRSIVSLEDVAVVTARSLVSLEGPLPSDHEVRVPIPDLGPLEIELVCTEPGASEEKAGAKKCAPESGTPRLTFSKQLRGKDVLQKLVVSSPLAKIEPLDETVYDLDLDRVMNLVPGKKYKVTLKAGLTALDKDRLAADKVFELEIPDHAPRLSFRDLEGDTIVESARPEVRIHTGTMNVPTFEAIRAPLDEKRLYSLLATEKRTAAMVRALPNAITSTVETKAKRNENASSSFDLPPSLRPKGGSGLYAIATSAAGIADEVRVLSVTDLGLTTKWSPHGGLVWVTRLSSTAPVGNVDVRLLRRGQDAYRTTTNDDGVALIPAQVAATFLEEGSDPMVLVRAGDDVSFARLPPLDTSLAQSVGVLFPERRLYRPGETAFIKGVFRAPSAQGLVALPGRKVYVEAVDDENRALFATTTTLDAFGAFSCEMPIPRTVRLGFASIRARVGNAPPATKRRSHGRRAGDWEFPAHARITIDEYRTVEMKIEAKADRTEYLPGDRADVSVFGKYLFGAPMHDVPVEVRASRRPTSWVPKDLTGFSTDAHTLSPSSSRMLLADTDVMLDKDGNAKVPLALTLADQTTPEEVTFTASISDVSNAFSVGDDTSFVVHPADLYLGVRLAESHERPWVGRPVRAELAAAAWDGPRRAGVAAKIELLHRKSEREAPAPTGRSCDLVTKDSAVGCDLAVPEGGTYFIVARGKDTKGRAIAAAMSFDVAKTEPPKYKPPPPPPPPPPTPVTPAAPPPTFDQACRLPNPPNDHGGRLWVDAPYDKEHAVGDRAHVCLRGNGVVLFTQEREGVLAHEVRRIDRPGVIRDLPIIGLHHPNVSLALHEVSGRSGGFPAPNRMSYGHPSADDDHASLRVRRPVENALTVKIDTGEERRPGDEFDAKVRVTDGAGRPAMAQVTLWAVDQGVLELEPYGVPQLDQTFGNERRPDVITTDTRKSLLWERVGLHRTKAPSVRMGATSVSPRAHIGRSIFRPTAFFLPGLVTGADGLAKVRVKLPDNLTTWKVFAVAVTPNEGFGGAESSFVTNKPLIARPQLPRFLRAGDRFDALAMIDSMTPHAIDVKVQMRATGALAGSGETTIAVPANGHVPVRFPVTASGNGNAKVSFRADARGGLSDDVTIDEEVTIPTTMENIVLGGETRTRADETLGDLARARPDVGSVDYRFAATPLIGMAESIEGLLEYPYGCTEQLSSRLVPLIRLRAIAQSLGVALPKDVDGAVRTAIASLLSHQRPDGGFGFWQESAKSEPWLTIVALSALHTSKQAGFIVAQDAIDRAADWVEKAESLDGGARAMLEDLFASLGRPREKELRALATDSSHLPVFARALVAHGLAKVDRPLAQRILADVGSQAKLTATTATIPDEAGSSWRTHLSSETRTTAMTLRAFVAVDPQSPLVAKLARGLLGLRRSGRFATTQESAWALGALDDARALYAVPPSTEAALRLTFDGAELARANATSVASGSIPMAKLVAAPGARLSFTGEGAPLFYEATLRYARKEPPQTPLEHGIHVVRTMKIRRRDGESIPAKNLRVGDYVDVEVTLATPTSRELVVLDDPIPAGFEAVNQSFANGDRMARQAESSWEVTHRELRDDRVVSFFDRLRAGLTQTSYRLRVTSGGRFTHPPAKAECMYAPDVFGRTAATTIETR